ncbi:plasmid pRiA4b ORF-3 family protein [bacterium]|nr:MAG: plasmid pRiA4b ORF-3 family protein [bacterium]
MKQLEYKEVHQLYISLEGSSPVIWRRLKVEASTSLFELHNYIQFVFGWKNYHLYQFNKNGVLFGDVRLLEPGIIDVKVVPLNAVLKHEKDEMLYEYDFGDSWMHRIVLEKVIIDKEGGFVRPECVGGELASPPEDVGGMGGFAEFLEIWFDPKDPEHQHMRSWAGKKYHPDSFDLKKANSMLRMRKRYIEEYDFNINMSGYR